MSSQSQQSLALIFLLKLLLHQESVRRLMVEQRLGHIFSPTGICYVPSESVVCQGD